MPRIVLAQKLQWDPAIDILLQPRSRRASSRPPGSARSAPAAARASKPRSASSRRAWPATMRSSSSPRAATSPTRRREPHRSAARRRVARRWPSAPRRFAHVMAPHPGGVHAALAAARCRRRLRRAHRPRGPRDARRHLARAADGQAHHDARLARAPRRRSRRISTRRRPGCSTGSPASTRGSTRTPMTVATPTAPRRRLTRRSGVRLGVHDAAGRRRRCCAPAPATVRARRRAVVRGRRLRAAAAPGRRGAVAGGRR